MSNMLAGRVAVITGSGRGLGRAHALTMAAQGARVVVNDLGVERDGSGASNSAADETVAEIRRTGGEAVANYDSVGTSAGAQAIIDTAVGTFGRLDILVNNAGFLRDRMIFNMTDDEWDAVIKVHLYGTFYCTRAACRIMKEQGFGRIINTSSASAFGNLGQANYAAAKEAIVGLTRTVAKEMARYGVTCNAVRPGGTSRMNLTEDLYEARVKTLGEEKAKEWRDAVEAMHPENVSVLMAYLATEQAAYINGCVFEARGNVLCMYADPPRIARMVIKMDGDWCAEDLISVMSKTLARDLRTLPMRPELLMAADSRSWEYSDGELRETNASRVPFDS